MPEALFIQKQAENLKKLLNFKRIDNDFFIREKLRIARAKQIFTPEIIAKRAQSNKNMKRKRNLVSCLFCHNTIPINVFGKQFHKEGKCKCLKI